ncbi:MAG: YigZ family protein [Firmicutes bacterium]|nr:YigZ family protein [Bacillota bacterium]
MRRLLAPCVFKLREKASVFLAEVHPAPTVEVRNEVLARLRKRDFDATHHCWAWRSGDERASDDDGEPSGTAGAPMLRVLEGQELTEILAVCIRWFGGTKLGTGGLVRAYTESLQGALAEAEAQGLFELVKVRLQGSITVPNEQAHLPFTLLGAFPDLRVVGQDSDMESTTLRLELPPEDAPALDHAWQERSRGGRILWDSEPKRA